MKYRIPQIQIDLCPWPWNPQKLQGLWSQLLNLQLKTKLQFSPSWTFHLYVITLWNSTHMDYIGCSRACVPISIYLMDSFCLQGSYKMVFHSTYGQSWIDILKFFMHTIYDWWFQNVSSQMSLKMVPYVSHNPGLLSMLMTFY